jgi:HEPN domain-containing protein
VENESLWRDYLRRAGSRLKALQVLLDERSWADVVRESQEVVELCLKALVRASHIEVPRVHDVSPILDHNRDRFPESVRPRLDDLIRISRQLRRDRELAFYGSEDLTPSEFYTREDALLALSQAREVEGTVAKALEPKDSQ